MLMIELQDWVKLQFFQQVRPILSRRTGFLDSGTCFLAVFASSSFELLAWQAAGSSCFLPLSCVVCLASGVYSRRFQKLHGGFCRKRLLKRCSSCTGLLTISWLCTAL
jgi:hypothetical protein